MKNIIALLFTMMLSYTAFGQLKVASPNGDVLITNTSKTITEANLDIDVISNDRNIFQAGSFGIQSLTPNNGFIDHNSYFDINQGGAKMVLRNTGRGSLAQFFDGRIIYRTVPFGTAGQAVNFIDAFTIQNNGNMQIGYPWNQPQPEKLEVNGSVAANGIILNSDKRLKQDVEPFTRGITELMQLNPISYRYNGKAGTSSKGNHIGIFAQELQKVAPEMVKTFEYEEINVISDIEGKVEKTGNKESYLRINDTGIKYMMINAIKEQQLSIDEKDERISELEDKIIKIESLLNDYLIASSELNIQEIDFSSIDPVLKQNIPNPFNQKTIINYSVPETAKEASMVFYDVSGKKIKSVKIELGIGQIVVNPEFLGSGMYTYSLVVDGKLFETKQMILSK